MMRANLTAIEKRIAAAEIVHHQRRNAFAVVHQQNGMIPAEEDAWRAEHADVFASSDLVVIIKRFCFAND